MKYSRFSRETGCIITGNLSDVMGRKPVMIGCLLGNVISNIVVARSKTLAGVAWGRIIGGVTGGLTPIAQAAVADVVSPELKIVSHSSVVEQEGLIVFLTVTRFFYQLFVIVLVGSIHDRIAYGHF